MTQENLSPFGRAVVHPGARSGDSWWVAFQTHDAQQAFYQEVASQQARMLGIEAKALPQRGRPAKGQA